MRCVTPATNLLCSQNCPARKQGVNLQEILQLCRGAMLSCHLRRAGAQLASDCATQLRCGCPVQLRAAPAAEAPLACAALQAAGAAAPSGLPLLPACSGRARAFASAADLRSGAAHGAASEAEVCSAPVLCQRVRAVSAPFACCGNKYARCSLLHTVHRRHGAGPGGSCSSRPPSQASSAPGSCSACSGRRRCSMSALRLCRHAPDPALNPLACVSLCEAPERATHIRLRYGAGVPQAPLVMVL